MDLLNRIENGQVLVSDGATGTFLQNHGLSPGGSPEEFNESRPEIIKKMARSYFEAGSDMVLTNSFGGTIFRQGHYGYSDKVHLFNKLSAEHAVSQKPETGFVCGSIGPTGGFLEPLGEISRDEMSRAFLDQIKALEAGGVDAVVIETMLDLEEAKVAIDAAREHTELTVIVTMTFDKGPKGFFTMMGATPEHAARELSCSGAHIIGSNCGNGINNMIDIASQMKNATELPLLIHSNAGIPSLKGGEILYPEDPTYMVEGFLKLRDAGVNIIGGCCGTTPEHIKALSEALTE
jgi:5-methyltetrahydrofolate--homocysteine methyltransferase